jgi:hypothetical protein
MAAGGDSRRVAGRLKQACSPAHAAPIGDPAIIDFPGYTPGQLAAIFTTLAAEAGFTLTPAAKRKAAAVLAHAEAGQASGNARLAIRLLTQVTAAQAHRITTAPELVPPHNSALAL